MGKLVIDGNSVYEIDEECIRKKELQEHQTKARQAQERAGRNTGRRQANKNS